jgi:hypothetical protein
LNAVRKTAYCHAYIFRIEIFSLGAAVKVWSGRASHSPQTRRSPGNNRWYCHFHL